MRFASIAAVCLLALVVGPATARADTAQSSAGVSGRTVSAQTSSVVRALRRQIRVIRGRALWNAYRAALPVPGHGRAERRATTVAQLTEILDRWQRRLNAYAAAYERRLPVLLGLRCIHHYEGPWNAVSDTAPTYYGGLQMDRTFERAYGADMLAAYGGLDANSWSPHDQLMVAMRGYRVVGYTAWPNTAAICGLL